MLIYYALCFQAKTVTKGGIIENDVVLPVELVVPSKSFAVTFLC